MRPAPLLTLRADCCIVNANRSVTKSPISHQVWLGL